MDNIILKGSYRYFEAIQSISNSTYLMFNLPFLCNYRCLKCCNLKEQGKIPTQKKVLSLKEIETLLEEAGDLSFKVLVIAGEGEPMLNRNFKAIVSLATKFKILPYVFTNGVFLDKKNIDLLAENHATLVISLDSLDSECYSRLSGEKGNLEKVRNNIQECRKVYKSLHEFSSQGKIVSLAINTVVTQLNFNEVEKIQNYCSDDIVFVCNRPSNIGLAEENWNFLYGNEVRATDMNRIIDKYSNENPPLGSTSDEKWCAYMRNGVSIGYDGSILACAYATDTAGFYGIYKKGNLKKINEVVTKSIDSFYSQFNHSRCILRHPNYKKWINKAKLNKELSINQNY